MEIKISTSELSHLIDEWIFNERNRKIVSDKMSENPRKVAILGS